MTRSRVHGNEHAWRQYVLVGVLLMAALAGMIDALRHRPVTHPPGMLVAAVPRQVPTPGALVFEFAGYTLLPRARFAVEARILAIERYRFDPGAALAPFDFALGWGPMSDTGVLDAVEVTQGSRFYTIYPREPQLDLAELLRHSANMHLIPANDLVELQLRAARVGQVVHLEGALVDASRTDGFQWRTSLTRADTGAGACELVFVERVVLD